MSAISAEPIALSAPQLDVRPYLRTPAHLPPYREPIEREIPRERAQPAPRVATRPTAKPRARAKARHSSALGVFAVRVALFCAVAAPTWCASSLAGQVMTASAFKDWKHAHERAESAIKAASALRGQVIVLTSDQTAEQWAGTHQMVAADDMKPNQKQKVGLVALNP